MTSNSIPRRELIRTVLVIAAFFTTAAYTMFGCGPSYTAPVPAPRQPKDAVTLTVYVRDSVTDDLIEGADIAASQRGRTTALQSGIGGSAYFFEGLRAGEVTLDVTASGYERKTVSTTVDAGYNKKEVVIRRRMR